MRFSSVFVPTALLLLLSGCSGTPAPPARADAEKEASAPGEEEAEIRESLGQLPPEDRKLAEDQRLCAVQGESRLGSMGKPFKVMVKDQAVFLCCKGCQKKALADPDKTLARVRALKAGEKPAGRPGD